MTKKFGPDTKMRRKSYIVSVFLTSIYNQTAALRVKKKKKNLKMFYRLGLRSAKICLEGENLESVPLIYLFFLTSPPPCNLQTQTSL